MYVPLHFHNLLPTQLSASSMFDEGVCLGVGEWGGGALGLLNSKKQNSEAQLAAGFGIGYCGPDLRRFVFSGGCTTLLALPVSSVLCPSWAAQILPSSFSCPTIHWKLAFSSLHSLNTRSTSFQTTG